MACFPFPFISSTSTFKINVILIPVALMSSFCRFCTSIHTGKTPIFVIYRTLICTKIGEGEKTSSNESAPSGISVFKIKGIIQDIHFSSGAGNLIADTFRQHFDADCAFQNRGGIRCNLPKGLVSRRDLFELLPFGNHPVLLELKGVHLEGVRKLGDPGSFARRYYREGIDEIIYIDSVASLYERNTIVDIVRHTSSLASASAKKNAVTRRVRIIQPASVSGITPSITYCRYERPRSRP